MIPEIRPPDSSTTWSDHGASPPAGSSGSSIASPVMQLRRYSVGGGLYQLDPGFPTTIANGNTASSTDSVFGPLFNLNVGWGF